MKTTYLMIGACLLAMSAQAQYGGRLYPHLNNRLSSAKTVNLGPGAGYVTAGFYPMNVPGAGNFVIDRTDIIGQFTVPGQHFTSDYFYTDDLNCGAPQFILNCVGVSVIETTDDPSTPGQIEAYALAGAYDKGVFFATLDINGAPLNSYRWPLPPGINIPEEPIIVESVATPHEYYIGGGENLSMTSYVMKITGGCAVLWENYYNEGQIRAMIESPYAPSSPGGLDLIVVGSRFNFDGFFMTLNASNAGMGAAVAYNYYGTNCGDDWFTSIQVAQSTWNGTQSPGYIIGGRALCPSNPVNYQAIPWMIKLDPTGNVVWSTQIEHQFGAGGVITAEINDVLERPNPYGTNESNYEYYGIAACTDITGDHMVVWRLSENGGWRNPSNEFVYPLGTGTNMWTQASAAQIEIIGDGTGINDGFQAWSTDDPGVGNNHVFAKAYFNGVIGCNEIVQSANNLHAGPGLVGSVAPGTNPYPANPCPNNFTLFGTVVPSLESTWATCPAVFGFSSPPGDNTRTTGIAANSNSGVKTEVYPNPVTNKVMVSFSAADNSQIKIELRNMLGQTVKMINAVQPQAGTYQQEIDFESLGVSEGMYLLNVTVDHNSSSSKLLYKGAK
ncbi:MAG: T9SS type A sorting domain-containing protein [Bacteroidota bacterium]